MEKFSASVAGRHMACNASANLELAIPNWVPPVDDPTANNAANRGTMLHELYALMQGLKLKDANMMKDALAYTNVIRGLRRFKSLSEYTVTADWLHTKPPTTADLVLYVQDEIHIIDLKTGQIPVPVKENAQLLFYAACYQHLAPKSLGVVVHIVQPWAGAMEGWFVPNKRIEEFKVEARETEDMILAGNVQFMPGDHCKFCPANPHSRGAKGAPLCPAMMKMLYPEVIETNVILGME
jgi:hypothetical protein